MVYSSRFNEDNSILVGKIGHYINTESAGPSEEDGCCLVLWEEFDRFGERTGMSGELI